MLLNTFFIKIKEKGDNVQPNNELSPKSQPLSLFKKISNAIDSCSSSFGFIGGMLLFATGFVITIQVILRYVFSARNNWTDETATIFVLVAVFTTLALGLREGSHVRVQTVFDRLPELTQVILEIISYLFIFVFSLVYTLVAFNMTVDSITLKEISPMLYIPMWPVKALIFIGFIILTLQTLQLFVKKLNAFPEKFAAPNAAKKFTVVTAAIYFILLIAAIYIIFQVNMGAGIVFLLFIFLIASVPIGFTIAIISMLGAIGLMGVELGVIYIPQAFYMQWNNYNLLALPMFVFLGFVLHKSGMAEDMFAFARAWVGELPGGLAVATIVVCGIFAAVSGSSIANAVTIGLIAYPALVRYKYKKNMAAGMIAVGGTLGVMIPPSTAFITIGILTNESIGALFMAGLVPGFIAVVLLSTAAVIYCIKTKAYEPLEKISLKDKLIITWKSLGTLFLPILMLGGIYSGIFTPTEAAGVSVVYGILFSVITRRVSPKDMVELISSSTKTVAMIALLVAAGMTLSNVTAMMQIPQAAMEWVAGTGWSGGSIVAASLVIVFILGMFLDAGAITILTIPILYPIIVATGFDFIWYSIIFVLCTEIGLITPPVGMNCFVLQQITGLDLLEVVRGSLPFLLVLLFCLFLVAFIPELALWLPSTM
ncbi:MAG: TRAP transporter large permease subunit [Peptococcaceae bacterium]|nr:TRAP transporter large permease subunit [Peptococcaceae bacterium]